MEPSSDIADLKGGRGMKVKVTCVKCGAIMRGGYLVERDTSEIVPAGLGFYWIPTRGVLNVFKAVALKAFACPECGYVEQYVKDIEKDREKILLGPVDASSG